MPAPIQVSIRKTLEANEKRYLSLLTDCWAETGVGAAGEYEGHYHLGFTDVMYSPKGITAPDQSGTLTNGKLLVVPPRVWFKPLRLGEFWFIKFFQSSVDALVSVPDKRTDASQQTGINSGPMVCISSGSLELPFWNTVTERYGHIMFEIGNNQLTVLLAGSRWRIITL